jgi:hypothetical protein
VAITTVESIGTTARLGVARLGATRLGAVVTEDNLDKDLDGTYAWKRSDSKRLGRPVDFEDYSGWSVTQGDD